MLDNLREITFLPGIVDQDVHRNLTLRAQTDLLEILFRDFEGLVLRIPIDMQLKADERKNAILGSVRIRSIIQHLLRQIIEAEVNIH